MGEQPDQQTDPAAEATLHQHRHARMEQTEVGREEGARRASAYSTTLGGLGVEPDDRQRDARRYWADG